MSRRAVGMSMLHSHRTNFQSSFTPFRWLSMIVDSLDCRDMSYRSYHNLQMSGDMLFIEEKRKRVLVSLSQRYRRTSISAVASASISSKMSTFSRSLAFSSTSLCLVFSNMATSRELEGVLAITPSKLEPNNSTYGRFDRFYLKSTQPGQCHRSPADHQYEHRLSGTGVQIHAPVPLQRVLKRSEIQLDEVSLASLRRNFEVVTWSAMRIWSEKSIDRLFEWQLTQIHASIDDRLNSVA